MGHTDGKEHGKTGTYHAGKVIKNKETGNKKKVSTRARRRRRGWESKQSTH